MANTIKPSTNGVGGSIGIWWGQVAPNQTENDTDINGHGFRVRVRILFSSLPNGKGTHPIESELPNADLPLVQIKMPTTHGNGSRLSCGIIGGEIVTGYFLDPEGNIPIIDGVFARSINENQITAQEASVTTKGLRLASYSQERSKTPPSRRSGGIPPDKPAGENISRSETGLGKNGKGMQGIPNVSPTRNSST